MLGEHIKIQKSLKELVYSQLKTEILTGRIESDVKLNEIDLAERMNVSRTPIREALQKLAEEGLVSIEPRRGAYVSKISINEMLDLFDVRENLEGMAAELAARNIGEEDKERLIRLIEDYDKAVDNKDRQAIVEGDEAFHNLIVSSGGNLVLIDLLQYVQALSMRFRYLYYDDFSRYKVMPKEHKKITDAIISGNSDLARDEARSHIRGLKSFILSLNKH